MSLCCLGRLLDERDFHPPALAEGDSDAGFSQMPFDTQAGTQGGTQANLLTRFGAVDLPPRQRPPGDHSLTHAYAPEALHLNCTEGKHLQSLRAASMKHTVCFPSACKDLWHKEESAEDVWPCLG